MAHPASSPFLKGVTTNVRDLVIVRAARVANQVIRLATDGRVTALGTARRGVAGVILKGASRRLSRVTILADGRATAVPRLKSRQKRQAGRLVAS